MKSVQLSFNEDFTKVEEERKYWKTMAEVPREVLEFIEKTHSDFVFYRPDGPVYYCSQCLRKLVDYECSFCHKRYPARDYTSKYVFPIEDCGYQVEYYIFDRVDEDIILYVIEEDTYYHNPVAIRPLRTPRYSIKQAYVILPERLISCFSLKSIPYAEVIQQLSSQMSDGEEVLILEQLGLEGIYEHTFLYTNRLDDLVKTSLYRYTGIEKLKEYFRENLFHFLSLTVYPLCFPQFEYLVKMQLYHLACFCPHIIVSGKNFKERFGVDKKYYEFMKSIDISQEELIILQKCPTFHREILQFAVKYFCFVDYLQRFTTIEEIWKYFQRQKLKDDDMFDYVDYLECCERLHLPFHEKQVLFPKNFREVHDIRTAEVVFMENPEMVQEIYQVSKLCSLNCYEDQEYIIFPADSVYALVDESSQMSNCVRLYGERIARGECQIYFMRKKGCRDQSLVTVEVRDGKVVQARTRFNQQIDSQMEAFLKKWERQMIPVVFE